MHPGRDDLVAIGATAKVVREMLPKAHFATIYAKPLGRPLVDPVITEVSKDTWIALPRDMGLAFQPAIVLASSAAVAGPVTSEDLVAANAKAAGHADDGHSGVYFPDGVYQGGTVILTKAALTFEPSGAFR